ncbi:MAG TPA: acyl-ACP thioesterase domain-containing protein [Flavobacterium sp.]|jgi:acyl-ACP thioesterase
MPLSKKFTSIYSSNHVVDFTQCSPTGHLKYTDLCNLLQLTAAQHAELGGISFTDMQQADQAWVVSRMRVELHALPRWKDIVTVKTWIVSMENSRSVRALEMYCGGQKIVGCETFWAVFNTKTRRPESLALPYDHFEIYNGRFSSEERVKKITMPDTMAEISRRKVVLSDLDIVNHVNNVKYLEWSLDLVDTDLVLEQKLKSFDMNFMKELTLSDQVSIIGDRHEKTYYILKDGKPCFALELNWRD